MYKNIKIIFDSVIETEIVDFLKKNDVKKYIIVPKVEGCWDEKLKHMDTHIWPGTDAIIMILLEAEKAKHVIDNFKNFKKSLTVDVPLNAVISPVEEVI